MDAIDGAPTVGGGLPTTELSIEAPRCIGVNILFTSLVIASLALRPSIIAVLMRLERRDPTLFRQTHISLNGRTFLIYEFRT